MFTARNRFRVLLMALALACADGAAADLTPTNRPAAWARPVTLAGVPNLHQVTTNIYRSAQPTAEGMTNLVKLGVVTVVDLRNFHDDKDEIGGLALTRVDLDVNTWHPKRDELVKTLRALAEPGHGPLLIHCLHGADRTGAFCAAYRMVVQGWTADEAIREMTEGGYGYHTIWGNLPKWLRGLDVKALREEIARPAPPPVK